MAYMSQDPIGPPPHGSSDSLDLWGRVLDAADAPLPGAKVYWVPDEHAGTKFTSWLHAHRVGFTDEAGAFFAQHLPPGPCLLVADFQDMGVLEGRLRIDRGTRLTLPPPEGGGDLLLRFPVTPKSLGRVHGTVLDSKGAPVPGFPVFLLAPDRGDDFQRVAVTDAEGAYMHPWLLPGPYVLALPGSLRHLGGNQPFEVVAGRTSKVGVRLHPRPDNAGLSPARTYSVSMRVEDPLGMPVAGALVEIQAPGHVFPPLVTGADGMARAEGLPVRPVAAGVKAKGFRPMGLGWQNPDESETEFGGTLSLHRVARCRVLVVDAASGRPLRHANIHLLHDGNDGWKWTGLPFPDTDVQEIEVVPGEVTIEVECPGYRPHESRETVLLEGPEDPIVVHLRRNDAGTPPGGPPVP